MQKRLWPLLIACIVFWISPLLWAENQAGLTSLIVTPPAKSFPHTQMTLTFNHPVGYKIFTLVKPNRLVVDLENTRYVSSPAKIINFSGSEITDFRHGIQHGYNLRMVFDLKYPMHFAIETHHDKGFQIVLTLSALPPVHDVVLPSPVKQVIEEDIKNDIKAEKEPARPEPQIFVKSLPSDSVSAPHPKKHTFIVVVDAGHGGNDPGAHGPETTKEKNVTLAIAKDLQSLVNDQEGMKAVMTRKGDYYVGLRQRLMIARKAKGDIFVAIHADAFDDQTATGASVFALSLHGASSEAARWLAQKENYSELGGINLNGISDKDTQVRSVLIDLSQTATISASLQLGQNILEQLGKITDLHHNIVEQAPFMVLKSPDIPSILVETGFISNPEEEMRLKKKEYQEKIAHALMEGIDAYYRKDVQQNFGQAAVSVK